MLRIAHVASGDLWAGAEAVTLELVRELARDSDLEVRVVLMNGGRLADALAAAGIVTEIVDETVHGRLATLRGVLRAIRRFRPHLVHTHRRKENVLGAIAAKAVGAASLRTEHGWTEFDRLGWRLDKRAYAVLDRLVGRYMQRVVVAVSAELADKLRAQYGRDRVVVIENGIDPAAVRDAAASAPAVAIDARKRAVGIVGRLVPVKRHDRFLAAARLLAAESPGAYEFHILGDGPLRAEIERSIVAAELEQCVRLHGFQQKPAPIVAALDAVVMCSDHEGIPMTALEAAVLGVPLVVTPLPSLEQILRSGVRGVVCASGDPHDLAEGIRRATSEAFAPPCELPATWAYLHTTMAARYKQLYRSLVAGSSAA